MLNYVKSELLKQRHRFHAKLLWGAPLTAILLAAVLMAGSFLQSGSYNFWYTLLLPGSFTILISLTVSGEKRKNRHGLFSVSIHKKDLWSAQILLGMLFLFFSCLIFFLGSVLGGLFFGNTLSLVQNACGSLVLFLTFSWQIPLWMAMSEMANSIISIFLSLFFNFGFGVFFAAKELWWIPFSIPTRLMCPIIRVQPNGLPAEAGSPLIDPAVIFPGILITVILFLVCSAATSVWFEKREV